MIWGDVDITSKYYQGAVALPQEAIPHDVMTEIKERQPGYNIGLINFSYDSSATAPLPYLHGDNCNIIPFVQFFDGNKMSLIAAAKDDIARLTGKKRIEGKKLTEPKVLTPPEELHKMALNHIVMVAKKGAPMKMPRLSNASASSDFILDAIMAAGNKIRSRVVKVDELTATF